MSKLQNFPELQALVEEISTILKGGESKSSILYNLFDGDTFEIFYGHPDLKGYEAIRSFSNEFFEDKDYEAMESEGGGEGEGEYCYGVIRLGNKFYKAEWAYYSYNGCEYDYIEDTIKEVKPVEKTITIYE